MALFKDLIDLQSWSDDGSMSKRLLRHSLLLFACIHRYPPCVDKAQRYFTEWRNSNGTLRSALQPLLVFLFNYTRVNVGEGLNSSTFHTLLLNLLSSVLSRFSV